MPARRLRLLSTAAVLTAAAGVCISAGVSATVGASVQPPASTPFPVGVPNASEPSGMAPPTTPSPGFVLAYSTDFLGSSLPPGWSAFAGTPSNDAGAQWSPGHVSVGGGLLTLTTSQDPAYGGEWVAGGVCQCADGRSYGAFYVRSRMTGPGPTIVELLWPLVGWPPEIDFNETYGPTDQTMATLHYTSSNLMVHQTLSIDMTQWHTWGVLWEPKQVLYTVDGRVWARMSEPISQMPNVAMALHLQQQTWCSHQFACPSSPQSTLVDWVTEFAWQGTGSARVCNFPSSRSTLRASQTSQVASVAQTISDLAASQVSVVGYGDRPGARPADIALGLARARRVATALRRRLAALPAPVTVTATGLAATGSLSHCARVQFAP